MSGHLAGSHTPSLDVSSSSLNDVSFLKDSRAFTVTLAWYIVAIYKE